jgi:hypothetical protein
MIAASRFSSRWVLLLAALATAGCGVQIVTSPSDAGPDALSLDASADATDARADAGVDARMPDAFSPDSPDAFAEDAFMPDAFVPDAPDAFAPDAFAPDAFAPDAFAFDAFAFDAFGSDAPLPDAFSRDAFMPDAFSRDAFMPDAFSRDAFSPDAFAPDAFLGPDGGVVGGIDLRSAGVFAVLAGSTVTSTGFSMITGNVGVSPGTALIGFPPATVVGVIHLADPVAAIAKLDLTTAYIDAAGRSTAPISVSGNLGGMTLAPGLYRSTSSLAVSSGALTLDAGGNANAVFIFQAASTFTMTSGRQIILAGGARAANIYWQVGTSATIGSTAVLAGTILADQSITLETGARVDGRVLTRIGAVTLDSAIVIVPSP